MIDPETMRRMLRTHILNRMAMLEDILGPAATDTPEWRYLGRMRDEMENEEKDVR
jgi:hypothetical protein